MARYDLGTPTGGPCARTLLALSMLVTVIDRYMHDTSRSTAWEWLVKLVEVPGAGASPLDRSYVVMESRRSCESQSASPYCGLPRQILVSKGLRRGRTPHCATARPRFRSSTFLPIIDVTASDIGRLLASSFSQRSRKLCLKTARLTLTTATQRPPTATGGMHTGSG